MGEEVGGGGRRWEEVGGREDHTLTLMEQNVALERCFQQVLMIVHPSLPLSLRLAPSLSLNLSLLPLSLSRSSLSPPPLPPGALTLATLIKY